MRLADLLFCNEQEALNWCQTDNIDRALEKLQDTAKAFAVTRGGEGSVVFDGNQYFSAPAQPITAVDTNGAGDMFAGAYLYGITQGYNCLCSGVCQPCRQCGGGPVWTAPAQRGVRWFKRRTGLNCYNSTKSLSC